jgi:hypothetical protein
MPLDRLQVDERARRGSQVELAPAFERLPVARRVSSERGDRGVERGATLGRHVRPRHGVDDHARLAGRQLGRQRRPDLYRVAGPDRGRVRGDQLERLAEQGRLMAILRPDQRLLPAPMAPP